MDSSVWQAVRFEQVMPVGRTRPILLECVRGTSARRERARFVTKAIGLPEVQGFSLAQELLGARLARAYGLAAPVAELVMLSPGFLTAAEADFQAAGLQINPGVAVGVEFIPDLPPFPVPVRLADDEMSEAAVIYVFDLLIQNPDRSLRSPNCGRAGHTVVPYDFETAFSFRFAVPKTDPGGSAGCLSRRTTCSTTPFGGQSSTGRLFSADFWPSRRRACPTSVVRSLRCGRTLVRTFSPTLPG